MATIIEKRCDRCGCVLTGNFWSVDITAMRMKNGACYYGHTGGSLKARNPELCTTCAPVVLSSLPGFSLDPLWPAETPQPQPQPQPKAEPGSVCTTCEQPASDHRRWCPHYERSTP